MERIVTPSRGLVESVPALQQGANCLLAEATLAVLEKLAGHGARAERQPMRAVGVERGKHVGDAGQLSEWVHQLAVEALAKDATDAVELPEVAGVASAVLTLMTPTDDEPHGGVSPAKSVQHLERLVGMAFHRDSVAGQQRTGREGFRRLGDVAQQHAMGQVA